jgi:hypothetical protein
MNYILKAIKDHPEAFDLKLDGDTSLDNLLRIVYSVKNNGTSIQQNLLTITKLYFGWTVLVKLGLRPIAMPLGVQLLQNFNWNNHYLYAADICNQLMKHYYMFDNGEEAQKYELMFKNYQNICVLEAEMETLYCKMIYKSDHGIEIDKVSINKDMEELESRLKFDSCKYHFYYYQCKCIISDGEEFEKWCLAALAYFKNLFFKHELYYNAFITKLYKYYLKNEEYDKVKNEIPNYIDEAIEGSKSWYRLKYIYCIALLNCSEIEKAEKEMIYCQSLKMYKTMSDPHQEEWEYLASTIKSELHQKVKVKKE